MHVGFYLRFIKHFSKIAHPLYKLLEKESMFNFDDTVLIASAELKKKFVFAPIIAANGGGRLRSCLMPLRWRLE